MERYLLPLIFYKKKLWSFVKSGNILENLFHPLYQALFHFDYSFEENTVMPNQIRGHSQITHALQGKGVFQNASNIFEILSIHFGVQGGRSKSSAWHFVNGRPFNTSILQENELELKIQKD